MDIIHNLSLPLLSPPLPQVVPGGGALGDGAGDISAFGRSAADVAAAAAAAAEAAGTDPRLTALAPVHGDKVPLEEDLEASFDADECYDPDGEGGGEGGDGFEYTVVDLRSPRIAATGPLRGCLVLVARWENYEPRFDSDEPAHLQCDTDAWEIFWGTPHWASEQGRGEIAKMVRQQGAILCQMEKRRASKEKIEAAQLSREILASLSDR